MSKWYANSVLTVIALLLAVIAAKLVFPEFEAFGVGRSSPTWGDIMAAGKITNSDLRRNRMLEIRANTPVIWVTGGELEVNGQVDVQNIVEVEGQVRISD